MDIWTVTRFAMNIIYYVLLQISIMLFYTIIQTVSNIVKSHIVLRVRFVQVRIRITAMADTMHDFGHFQLPIASLFMVKNIKCG